MIYPKQYDITPEGKPQFGHASFVEVSRDERSNIVTISVFDEEGDEISLTESSARKLIAALQHALTEQEEDAA